MISISHQRSLLILTAITAALTAVVAVVGIARPQIYRPFTPETLIPGTISQDLFSLLAAAGLVLCMVAIRRGSWRGWVLWAALNGYLFYAYALYSFERLYNPFFLAYVALAGLTLYSLIYFVLWLQPGTFERVEHRRLPHRTIAAYMVFLAAMFVVVWLSRILPAIRSQIVPDGASIFVMDLAFFLPLLVITARLLLLRRSSGALITPILLIKVGMLGLSVLLGTLFQPLFGFTLDAGSVVIYTIMGGVTAALGLLALARVDYNENAADGG